MVMTQRLYHTDANRREFTARIVAREERENGMALRLDRTAFYPTSGGQPYDTGKINDIAVIEVWEDDHGEVWHLVDNPPQSDEVHGEIDWSRRFDHMQQHSGQHLLSAAFVHLLDAPTVSFHLGRQDSSIDLDTTELTWDAAFQVEAEVNRVIWKNLPVEIHVVDEEEIHKVPLRKPPTVSGKIRVIWVRDYDASACGGTHVEHTGAIGLIKVTRIERYKGGVRVSFLCGGRALRDYQRVLRDVQQVSAELSVGPDELGDAIARLRDENKEARRSLKATQGELAAFEADRLWRDAREENGVRRIVMHLEDRTFEQARAIASLLSARPLTLALLAVSDAKGTRLVCQRSEDMTQIDAAAVLSSAAKSLGGHGGGNAGQAQGGAPTHSHETILDTLTKAAVAAEPD
jgi:alanyl-tRNA synthetase